MLRPEALNAIPPGARMDCVGVCAGGFRCRDRRRTLLLVVLAAVLSCRAGAARAHEPQRLNAREIVRLAGTFGDAPQGVKNVRDVAVTA